MEGTNLTAVIFRSEADERNNPGRRGSGEYFISEQELDGARQLALQLRGRLHPSQPLTNTIITTYQNARGRTAIIIIPRVDVPQEKLLNDYASLGLPGLEIHSPRTSSVLTAADYLKLRKYLSPLEREE